LSHYLVIRLEPKIERLLRKVARARGQDVSNFVRAIIRAELAKLSLLSDFEKKALAVLPEDSTTLKKEGGNP